VCTGVNIDKKKKNPFAPSAVNIGFALADSIRFISLVCSGEQGNVLSAVIGASYGINDREATEVLENWDTYCAASNVARRERYIITGNLLQAFSDFPGKLVSFTTNDGGIRKGILMPPAWKPKEGGQSVIVPIGKAMNYIKNMSEGNSVVTTNDIAIYRNSKGFKIISPKRSALKTFYTDRDIISLLFNKRDGFEMISGQMVAFVEKDNIGSLVEIMQQRYSMSITISESLFEVLHQGGPVKTSHKDPLTARAEQRFRYDKENFEKRKPPATPNANDKEKRLRIAKVKAQAKLKILELLNI